MKFHVSPVVRSIRRLGSEEGNAPPAGATEPDVDLRGEGAPFTASVAKVRQRPVGTFRGNVAIRSLSERSGHPKSPPLQNRINEYALVWRLRSSRDFSNYESVAIALNWCNQASCSRRRARAANPAALSGTAPACCAARSRCPRATGCRPRPRPGWPLRRSCRDRCRMIPWKLP